MKTISDKISLQMKAFEELRTLLIEQKEEILSKDLGVEREKLNEVSKYNDTPFPVVISGLRRAGKSTLKEIISTLILKTKDF